MSTREIVGRPPVRETGSGGNGHSQPSGPGVPAGDDEKRTAVEQVLRSATFLRAEQLRNFLRYICEMELAGRATELSEYLIGVEALGRPPGYSTGDDSSVRRRAHALRQKLEEVYADELLGSPVRIDLPKGSYVPRFVMEPPARTEVPEEVPAPELSGEPRPNSRPAGRGRLAAAFLAGAAIASAVLVWTGTSADRVDPVLIEGWGPLARPGANLLICIASPPHLAILPYPDGPLPPGVSLLPQDTDILPWYRQRYPMRHSDRLGIHKVTGPLRLGEVQGALSALRLVDRLGMAVQIVAEKNIGLLALRGRNVLLLGNPEFSYAASSLLERGVWTVAYDPANKDRVLRPREGVPDSVKAFVPVYEGEGRLAEVFGLITVLQSDGASESDPARTVVISCTHSAGCQAATEFFSSAASMRALRERFRGEGKPTFPASYQVVVRCKVHIAQALSGQYEAHLTLPLPK